MTRRGGEVGAQDEFFILSLKWTRGSPVTWWRPKNVGYTTDLLQAGRYSRAAVLAEPDYYDNKSSTLAVPCDAVLQMVTTRVYFELGREGLKPLRAARKRAFRKTASPRDGDGGVG